MFGGIKVRSFKESTRDEKIENLPFPEQAVFYTSQHIGAPSEVIVTKGQDVKRGELIARFQGTCSANLYSSISGKVKEISNMPRPDGKVSEAIVVQKVGEQSLEVFEPLEHISQESIRERVKKAGVVGMGGAGFPAHIKLDPPKKIQTAFLNGCECEPFLTADERLMVEEPEKVAEGFRLAKTAVGAFEGVVGIEDDKKQAISVMRKAVSGMEDIRVEVLPKIYPQGYEKMLITAVTGKEVPSGGLPHDIGASVHNIGTCLAIYEAIHDGKPLIDRVFTLTGPRMIDRVNARVSIGMKISEILECYQIENSETFTLLMGGPMMGFSLDSPQLAVTKTTSGLLIKEPGSYTEHECSSCGKCVDVCPMGLVAQRLNRFFDGDAIGQMKEEGLRDCMECGCCSYICPCRIPLTYKFKTAKLKL